ncbi:MAG: amidohydrolase family protein [Phycisphaerae bacterium]|nr:amidohydrolase family protein [Phycisphaerae bacterium]
MTTKAPIAANLHGLDYRLAAADLGPPVVPIHDIHLHVNGPTASRVYREVADLFGVERMLSQTRLADADAVRAVLGDRVRFVAVPNWSDPDRGNAFRAGFLEHLRRWHDQHGARVVKFWAAPRLWELLGTDARDAAPLDSPWRVRAAELAMDLGMMFMAHVADPDTWFRTRYADATRFPPKIEHYAALERMVSRFDRPWIAAHMGGWPEDLGFLDGLLTRHANLYLDTSATKWIVRELGAHPRERTVAFFEKWRGRLLFGSDIVTLEDHMAPRAGGPPPSPMSDLANSPESAFELYASRYYALRTMFETRHEGPSPIADPDLKMVDPTRHSDSSSPTLRGLGLSSSLLRMLYRDAAAALVDRWIAEHP